MSQLCSHSWLKNGNGNPLPDEFFGLLRLCVACRVCLQTWINNPWAKMSQRCTATGVTFRKAAFKLVPFDGKYPNKPLLSPSQHHNHRVSACSPDFSHQKRALFQQASQASQRHWLFGSSINWPPHILLRILSLAPRPPYFHHAFLAAFSGIRSPGYP